MGDSQNFSDTKKRGNGLLLSVGYWLVWAFVLAVLAWGVNRYFEHRTRELDKRLERLR
ncbi:MAG: hypothetical protein HY842_03610 [Bacteroidetes bacterium]|nr:hypothetical protein [Bacteroidota bacterium]